MVKGLATPLWVKCMGQGSLGRASGILLGVILIFFGAWGLVFQEYSSDGYRWRGGLHLEGFPAVLTGAVVLIAGIYVIYLSFSKK
jgi:hypothetical protein